MRHLRRARAALTRHRRNLARALSGPTAIALIGAGMLGAGISDVFGAGWAAIVVGALSIIAAVRTASVRRR